MVNVTIFAEKRHDGLVIRLSWTRTWIEMCTVTMPKEVLGAAH